VLRPWCLLLRPHFHLILTLWCRGSMISTRRTEYDNNAFQFHVKVLNVHFPSFVSLQEFDDASTKKSPKPDSPKVLKMQNWPIISKIFLPSVRILKTSRPLFWMDTRANLGIVTEVGMQIYVAKFSTAETSVANFASAAARRGTFLLWVVHVPHMSGPCNFET